MINYEKVYCRGSARLKQLISPLVKLNIISDGYVTFNLDRTDLIFFPRKNIITWSNTNDIKNLKRAGYMEITPETFKMFYTSKKSEQEKYLGFIGSSSVNISLLPKNIIPTGWSSEFLQNSLVTFFYNPKVGELDYSTSTEWVDSYVTIMDFNKFIIDLNILILANKRDAIIGPSMETPNILSEESTKLEKLKLSNINTFKIVL